MLGDYRVRSKAGIKRHVNFLPLCYSAWKLSPYSVGDFRALRGSSPQQVRLTLGRLIRQEIFFSSLAKRPEIGKNALNLLDSLKSFPLASLKAS